MDLLALAALLRGFFQSHGFPFAFCGGTALGCYGYPFPTFDVDVVTVSDAQEELVGFLEREGFLTLHRSPGFSNHLHERLGRVDVVYVRGRTAAELFARVRRLPGPGGGEVPVVAPEHLVAMKLAAMADDPSRIEVDRVALAFLLRLPDLAREEVRGFFERYGFGKLYRELQRGVDVSGT
ncbi:MAG: hypothetical protein ACP5NF_06330 [Thermoanaerobaculum sp.]